MKKIFFLSFLLYTQLLFAEEPVRAEHGMVASSERIASRVGVEILQQGGNAVDAAVAVGFALAVTHPAAGNLGGGGFMMIRQANGKATAIDYRETSPMAASHNMYVTVAGEVIPDASTIGYKASGVPGTVRGLALALKKYGTMKWSDVIEPARKLAQDGFTISKHFAKSLRRDSALLSRFSESKRIFLRDGNFYNEGDTLRQPELARTLQRLQEKGPDDFYSGKTAELIARDMTSHGGTILREDLAAYKAVERVPLRGTYRGREIITMPPPSSGGAVLIEMLNMLEHYDVRSLGSSSEAKYHLLAEVMRRGFRDRAEHFGDPDFIRMPIERLISKSYATKLFSTIDTSHATASSSLSANASHESEETTHFTVVDGKGNAVSNTYTLNGSYGSGVTIFGAGFLMNNEMDDFAAKPGTPNMYGLVQSEKNSIAPHKRPLSSMTPTFVLNNGKLLLAIGSPGGPTIINTVFQIIVNIIDHDMNLQDAINASRIHHQWLPDLLYYEANGLPSNVLGSLRRKGHTLKERSAIGDAEGVVIEGAILFGGYDHRNADASALGY